MLFSKHDFCCPVVNDFKYKINPRKDDNYFESQIMAIYVLFYMVLHVKFCVNHICWKAEGLKDMKDNTLIV